MSAKQGFFFFLNNVFKTDLNQMDAHRERWKVETFLWLLQEKKEMHIHEVI